MTRKPLKPPLALLELLTQYDMIILLNSVEIHQGLKLLILQKAPSNNISEKVMK